MARTCARWCLAAVLFVASASIARAAAVTDPFDGPKLHGMWTFRSPDNNDKWEIKNGWLVWDIQANQDLYVQGVDRAPMLLANPPADDANFTIETVVNVVTDQPAQPNASHAGLILFKEQGWTYTLWGPYNNADIRVEDCIGGAYRWRAQAGIAVDAKIDKDVWLRVVKRGAELEFLYKDSEADKWQSGGVDKDHIGPLLTKGSYKIGLFLKNWGGSVAMKTSFDYFHSPELGAAVEAGGKATTTWAALKLR